MPLIEKLKQPTSTGISLIDKLRGLVPTAQTQLNQGNLENVLTSSRQLGEQVREKVGQPLTRTLPLAKRVGETILSPGTELVSPRLKQAGVSPIVAGGVGLGLDILAPGGGEFKQAGKIAKEIAPIKTALTQEAKKYKSAEEFVKANTYFRGEGPGTQTGNYYSTSRDFARDFTRSGLDSEIIEKTVASNDIYKTKGELPFALDENAIDNAIKEAKNVGKKAILVDEGMNQPNSIFVFDKTALKTKSQLTDIWNKAVKKGKK